MLVIIVIFECVVCKYKAKGLSYVELGFVGTRKRKVFVCEDCAKEIAHNLVDSV